ncbi:MAG: imidazoleglycerol-phosphate dehydratase HisB [Clostridiales bacterium]|nr:imidazoleglycerol-phosphate dehydratase HisB [Clostridiales bacterium]
MRQAALERKTKETEIELFLDLDGGDIKIETGIGFFDHMLNSFATHSGISLIVNAKGDLHVDCHHLVEDVGIVLGQAFRQALADKKGLRRFADAFVPMDEALCLAVVDLGGRAYLVFDAPMPQERCGEYDTCMTEEFLRSFAFNAGMNLHVKCLYGSNAHHITEAIFKALAKTIKEAIKIEGAVLPSTKGVL